MANRDRVWALGSFGSAVLFDFVVSLGGFPFMMPQTTELWMTTTPMEPSPALAELLGRYGFRRHSLTRNRLGHFQLVGQLGGRRLDILLDTGAASTVVDLGYCTQPGHCDA